MRTKLFFFDLDGTLLTGKKTISPATYEALTRWHAAGHRIAISSGRPLPSVLEAIRENGLFPFSPFAIAFNGAQIYDCASRKTILKETLPLSAVRTITGMAKEAGLHIQTYNDTHILTPAVDDEIRYYTRVIRMPVQVLPDFPEGITEPPCKMLCIDLNGPALPDAFAARVTEHFSAASSECPVTAIRSNPYYLEIFRSSAGKGAAVSGLASLLSIPLEDTYAAGDAPNDISMLRAAGCGIAMCNGNPETRSAADLVTKTDNDHDGLAPILLRFLH